MIRRNVYTLLVIIVSVIIFLYVFFHKPSREVLLLREWSLSHQVSDSTVQFLQCLQLPFYGEQSPLRIVPRGVYWLSTTFTINTFDASYLYIHRCDDTCEFYLNKKLLVTIPGFSSHQKFSVKQFLRQGMNELDIKVRNSGGSACVYSPLCIEGEEYGSKSREYSNESEKHWEYSVVYEIDLKFNTVPVPLKKFQEYLPMYSIHDGTVLCFANVYDPSELALYIQKGQSNVVRNYYAIDKRIGTLQDFYEVVTSAHQRNLKVIIDFSPDRTAWDSDLILVHPEWYVRNDNGEIISPNCGEPWTAKLNVRSHEVKKYLLSVMRYWVDSVGVDGFRIHSASEMPTEFWDLVRTSLGKGKNLILIGTGTNEQGKRSFDAITGIDVGTLVEKTVVGYDPSLLIQATLGEKRLQRNSLVQCTININELRKLKKISETDVQSLYVLGTVLQMISGGIPFITAEQYSTSSEIIPQVLSLWCSKYSTQTSIVEKVNNSVVLIRKQCADSEFLVVMNYSRDQHRGTIKVKNEKVVPTFQHRAGTIHEKNGEILVQLWSYGVLVFRSFKE
ncbi:MAG: alpha-amylase family glycosyl hydrolase [Bacteroidetes bacterium]|nr:alpha-amylase family glycosyl hydrolase [Bacteroidota bacterium]